MPTLLGARHEYAVLCPLLEQPDGLHFLFEVRASAIRQAGETCFPGGRMEPGESPTDCALRETMEELAIPPSEIQILGREDFICNQRGFLLCPVLGLVSAAGIAARLRPLLEVAEALYRTAGVFPRHAPGALQLRVDSHVCRRTFPTRPWASPGAIRGTTAGSRSRSGRITATLSGA